MSTPDYGAIVARRWIDLDLPWEPGQQVSTYVLLAPLPAVAKPKTTAKRPRPSDAHEAAAKVSSEVRDLVKSGAWRTGKVHRCDCSKGPTLATETFSPDGRRWVLLHRGESIPPAFRKAAGGDTAPKAWPLHREPNGAPHVDLMMCARCRKTYAVALTEDSVTLVPARPHYDARVTP